MALGTRFVANFPRRSRPRGLGYAECGQALSGLGTWVVDTEYGLGPRFRQGYNRPYPPEAMPVRWPRAQAARVLGPSSGTNVVARPYAATRLSLTRYPVRMAPVTAPGGALRNPGVAGYGRYGFMETAGVVADIGYAATQMGTVLPVLAGLGLALMGRAMAKGPVRVVANVGALGGVTVGAISFYRNYSDARAAASDTGVAAAGARVGAGSAADARELVATVQAGNQPTDQEMLRTIASFSCYENARRARDGASWYERMTGTGAAARNPLVDCGLTAQQLADVKAAFDLIPRADRRRLSPGTFGTGGSLADLG